MKLSYWDYIRAAFGARPIGMFVPPNWLAMAAMGLLGIFVDPAFLLLGAGLEMAYLYTLAGNRRFQRVVRGKKLLESQRDWRQRLQALVSQLPPADQTRYAQLERRCQMILEQQGAAGGAGQFSAGIQTQAEALGRLTWVFLRLLVTRNAIDKVIAEAAGRGADVDTLEKRIAQLQAQVQEEKLGEDLRKSLTGQIDILQQRLERQREAMQKLTFLDAELTRISEQVELIREQAVLVTDPEVVSQRIDQIAATLGGTTQWIQEQQQIYGKVEDLMAEPAPILLGTATAQTPASPAPSATTTPHEPPASESSPSASAAKPGRTRPPRAQKQSE